MLFYCIRFWRGDLLRHCISLEYYVRKVWRECGSSSSCLTGVIRRCSPGDHHTNKETKRFLWEITEPCCCWEFITFKEREREIRREREEWQSEVHRDLADLPFVCSSVSLCLITWFHFSEGWRTITYLLTSYLITLLLTSWKSATTEINITWRENTQIYHFHITQRSLSNLNALKDVTNFYERGNCHWHFRWRVWPNCPHDPRLYYHVPHRVHFGIFTKQNRRKIICKSYLPLQLSSWTTHLPD